MSTTTATSSNNNNNGDQNGKPPSKPPGREPSGNHICEHCGKGYARTDNLRRHIKAEHETPDSFRCPYCTTTSKRKDNLDKHVKQVHDEIECGFEDCGWRGLAATFIQHVRTQHARELGERLYERAKEAFDDEDEDEGQGGEENAV